MDWSHSREFRLPIFNYSISTETTREQLKTEELVNDVYYAHKEHFKENFLKLYKIIHVVFAKSKLYDLPTTYESLDASQSWLIFWNVHALKLLNFKIPDNVKAGIIKDIKSCQSIEGGFGGGPFQLAHMATTYASVMSLVELQSKEALDVINRETLSNWFSDIKLENGAFIMHSGGEVDVRGCYCAVAVAKATGIYSNEMFENTAKWIASCQTYEGGFGGAPGLEAHGGYSFCALAALILLDSVHLIDIDRLLRWAVNRQMSSEGGFQGRTNKLVDSCYSYWVGALFPLIQQTINGNNSRIGTDEELMMFDRPLFDVNALEEYVVACCQMLDKPYHNPNGGGLIDKPGKKSDPYHTCYGLSGLSIAQSYERLLNRYRSDNWLSHDLDIIDPIFNVSADALEFCYRYNSK